MEQPSLRGKCAIVTGASLGIGRAVAIALGREGARVVITSRGQSGGTDALFTVQREIASSGGKAAAVQADVSQVQDVQTVVQRCLTEFGQVDILVNNAGITRDQLLLRMKEEDWDLVLAVNLKGTYNCTKAAIRHLVKQKGGKIVNIASVVGEMGNAGQANYSASKAGVIGFTKSIAREYASRNIQVNAVAPGFIDTAMSQAIPEKEREFLTQQIPMGRLGTPEDVAEAVLFLSSPAADYITGQVLNVNGGMLM